MSEDITWLVYGYTASKWLSKEQYQGVLKPSMQLLGGFQLSKLSEPDQSQIDLFGKNMVVYIFLFWYPILLLLLSK